MKPILRNTTSFSALTLLVGSFDPQKTVPEMTYYVFSGTLSPTDFTSLASITGARSAAEESATAWRDVVTSTPARAGRPTTLEDDDSGYWLVDETGRRLIYVRPNATGDYADAFRQLIGATGPTSAPQRRPRPGHGGQSSRSRGTATVRPAAKRRSYPGELKPNSITLAGSEPAPN